MTIDPGMTVEDLVERHPSAVSFLQREGVVCVKCGEPVWGTLNEAIERAGLNVAATIARLEEHLGRSGRAIGNAE